MAGLSYQVALVYLDDVIIFVRSFEGYLSRLDFVIGQLKAAGLKIKGSKFKFFQQKIYFLGHIVSDKRVEMDPKKVAAVLKIKNPTNNKGIESYIRTYWLLQKIHTRFWEKSRDAL